MAAAALGTQVKGFRDSGVRLLPLDPLLLLATLGLMAASLYTVANATQTDIAGDPNYFLKRQAIYMGVGLLLMLAISRFDYSRLREWKWGVYGFLIVSILLVYALGFSARGSTRAIQFGFFNFQASELGKVLLVVDAVGVHRRPRAAARGGRDHLPHPAAGADPGDARDRPARPRVGPRVPGGRPRGAVRGRHQMDPLRRSRRAGRRRDRDHARGRARGRRAGAQALPGRPPDRLHQPRGSTGATRRYQINQSLTAVGSGGKTGRGDDATQTKLDFLPEHHTDFIFSVVGEEFGFVGAALVLSLYALLIWRALRILTMAKNLYGALIAGGITAMLMFQVFVNVGMTIGIMPITGIPLPLMSYGGSSVLTTLIAIGLLQSIYAQARETTAAKGIHTL